VRSWALQSVEVAIEIAAADDARINALSTLFRRLGYDTEGADTRARTKMMMDARASSADEVVAAYYAANKPRLQRGSNKALPPRRRRDAGWLTLNTCSG